MLVSIKTILLQFFVLAVLSACATIPLDFVEPKVTVISFKALNKGILAPEFEIVLRVSNPNRVPLDIDGIAYTVTIDGHELMSGVANELPVIAAYGEGDVKLLATADMLSGFKLLTSLMNQGRDQIDYAFNAKLDVGAFRPSILVTKKGKFSFAGN